MGRLIGATTIEESDTEIFHQYELCQAETRCNLNNTDECIGCNHHSVVNFTKYAEDFIEKEA